MSEYVIYDPSDPPKFMVWKTAEDLFEELEIIETPYDFRLAQATKNGFCISMRINIEKKNA